MLKKITKTLCVISMGALVACGGGGEESSASRQSATGLWAGSTDTDRAVIGVVLSDGTYYFLYSRVGNPSVVAGVVQGRGSVSGNTISSSNGRDFNLEGEGIVAANISARVADKQSLNGSIAYSGFSTPFSTVYDSNFEQTPDLAAIAGAYAGNVATAQGTESATLTITSEGSFSGFGANTGCQVGGTVTPRTDGNVYDFTLTFGASPCFNAGQSYQGIAYYDSATQRLYAAAPNAARTNGVLFLGTK